MIGRSLAHYQILARARRRGNGPRLSGQGHGAPTARGDQPQPDVERTVVAVREALSGQLDWLLVFDNAEAPSGVRAFLPREGSGHVLVTWRNPAWRGLGRVLELGLAVEPPPGAGGDPPRAGG